MKKLFNLALVGTIVLAAAACQREQVGSSSEDANGNDVKEVTTQFVLNVAAAPSTKMSADMVQQNNNFRGIQDVTMYVYNTGLSNAASVQNPTSANTNKPYVLKTTAPAEGKVKEFDLGHFMSSSTSMNSGTNNLDNTSNRVLQLSIPVYSDAVLLYGKSYRGENTNNKDYGVTYDYNPKDPNKKSTRCSTPSKIQFAAQSILDLNKSKYDATANLMIYVINDLLSSYVSANNVSVGGVSYPAPALSWAQLGHQYEINTFGDDSRYRADDANVEKMTSSTVTTYELEGLEEVLGKCYYLFTYIHPANIPEQYVEGTDEWKDYVSTHYGTERQFGEYRGGSSHAIKKTVIDTYKVIKAASEAEPTNVKEANAKRLATVILARAGQYFNTATGEYQEVDAIKDFMDTKWNDTKYGAATSLNDFPYEQFGVPEGAAQLAFRKQGAGQTDDEFYYLIPNRPLVNPTMTTFEPRKYLFPAELWYYVNSPIRTTTSDVAVADYPNGVTNWNKEASWASWTPNAAVSSATRAVAVTNNINYGVALLKSTVMATSTTLQDNRAALTDETTDRSIPLSSSQISLRGILVGGMNPRMNWQFTRYYTTSGEPGTTTFGEEGDLSLFDGVIYDHSISDSDVTQTSGITNYTLVYDNYNSSAEDGNQNDVYVALEFVNGGDAFWGRDNMIPNGGVFYLVGKLPKPGAGDTISWPSDHQIPPLWGIDNEDVPTGKYAGQSKQIARVFIQDFMTTANFKINATSLKHAYYSVPDLRASQMSLGLSVDLQWTPGLVYNDIVL